MIAVSPLTLIALATVTPANNPELQTDVTYFEKVTYIDHVRHLAGRDTGGRWSGDPGMDRAADYIARAFRAYRLTPAGDNESYFQAFEIHRDGNKARAARFTTSITRKLREPVTPAKNVVGLLRGTGALAGQYVVIGAHYDHLGRQEPDATASAPAAWSSPVIFPGTDDNASGTAGVIELARMFSLRSQTAEPRRSLLFVAFAAEELGLLGSQHFVAHAPVPLSDIAAMLDLDMIGRLRDDRLQVFGADSGREFTAILRGAAADFGLRLRMEPQIGMTDHVPFCEAGIPAMHFYTGDHADYHRPTDIVERIQAGDAIRVIEFIYRVADDLCVMPARPVYQSAEAASRPAAP